MAPGAAAPGAETDDSQRTGDPIPDKAYFRIGEVARILGVKPYVLRYWESEFRAIKPQKSKSQQRLYRRKDVELLLRIKKLLYEQKFTIAGARQKLRAEGVAGIEADEGEAAVAPAAPAAAATKANKEFLERLRVDLKKILELVEE